MAEDKKVTGPSDLSEDINRLIDEKLVLYTDKVRFRAVCKSWNSITPKFPNLKSKQLPWLLHTVRGKKGVTHGLLNLLNNNVYLLYNHHKHRFCDFLGSSIGWVACSDFNSRDISLLNPLTQCRIKLPPHETKALSAKLYSSADVTPFYTRKLYDKRADKVMWSSDPKNDDCVVVACFLNDFLIFCKPGDDKWKGLFSSGIVDIVDALFHNGKLHVVLSNGELIVFEDINCDPMFTVVASNSPKPKLWSGTRRPKMWLLESIDGGLMMVEQETSLFRVYKHDAINLRWHRLENIGDEIIFLGPYYCTSISCSDFPGLGGNRIYFLDKVSWDDEARIKVFDIAGIEVNEACINVFDLADRSIEVSSDFRCLDIGNWNVLVRPN